MIGSIWRKWDLHFHTHTSHDYYDKSINNRDIVSHLLTKNVEGIAITDHHVIDITRIKELQKHAKGILTILPGIEFRSEIGGSEFKII